MRLLLRCDCCEEAALCMDVPLCRPLALWDMSRHAGHLYRSKHSTKEHRLARVAAPGSGAQASLSACEVKRTSCSWRIVRLMVLWDRSRQAGHLYSGKRTSREHRLAMLTTLLSVGQASIPASESVGICCRRTSAFSAPQLTQEERAYKRRSASV